MRAIVFDPPTQPDQKSWFVRPIAWRITPAVLLLAGILVLSLGLHLYNIQAIGEANTYYTAAVKSMLQSWHNFFFVAAEPGGSVTVDKPPLGLWIEAGFAAVLGVSGFSVTLPNIIAGVLSVGVLYFLVKKYFGTAAGLAAALVLALTPVSLAVDRNNTIDGMLILTLLLAAWAFIRATETGKLRHLLLGALLVGLGFNIKMLQAFLPLPAFYALYFFGAKAGWRRKILNLGLATVLLGVVSLAWAVTVDAIPASQRPFVGSTSSNSEMELIFGYNGINRLLGGMGGGRAPGGGTSARPDGTNPPNPPANGTFPPGGMPPQGPGSSTGRPTFPGQNRDGFGGGNGGPGGFDIGQAGGLRFFSAPLAKEMSWLLPFALLAMLLAAFSGRVRLPLISNEHKGLILWGGWLLTCLVFFSAAGFFHNYYLATLSPALGALVGTGFSGLAKLKERSRLLAGAALIGAAGSTLVFQVYLVAQFGLNGAWVGLAAVLLTAAGVLAAANLMRQRHPGVFFRAASGLALAAMLVIPAVWSARTVASTPSTMLPEAYAGDSSNRGFALGGFSGGGGDSIDTSVLNYLEANTQNIKYLVAVPSSHPGSNLVLQTGRPVLFMGGFTGSDPVVNASSLSRLVADGELRYVLYGGGGPGGPGGGNSDIGSWLANACQVVTGVGQSSTQISGRMGASTLYQCGI
jgi:4-amino-4-deoxy-L-arabinose transferase-like glycosyltransferase